MTPELTVVCPMYNEEAGIAGALSELLRAVDGLPFEVEVLVVDDGSTDQGARLAQEALAGRPCARVIGHTPNRGRGYALRQGFANARGRFIVTTEADLTWGADVPARLHAALVETGADVVVASPYRPGGGLRNVPLHRAATSRTANWFLRRVFPVTMATGMTRGYRADAIRSLPLAAEGKELHVEILQRAVESGLRVHEIPCMLTWPEGRKGRMPTLPVVARHLAVVSRHAWTRFVAGRR